MTKSILSMFLSVTMKLLFIMADKNESGSTIIGVVGLILSLFFLYSGLIRLWRRFAFDIPDYLLLGLFYLMLGLIFAGVAGYGLISRSTGAKISGVGSTIVASLLWLLGAYFMFKGQILNGTADDVFNALALWLGGLVLNIVGFGVIYLARKQGIIENSSSTETDVGLSEASEEIKKSWQEGSERGDTVSEEINSRYYQLISNTPSFIWTLGILLGSILSFSVWIFAVAESDTAGIIGLIGGMLVLFFTVLIDLQRVNWINDDLRFRWYLYVVPVLMPLIGWVFALLWLARKKQKTGSAIR